jgi:hypothetical protein
MGDHEGRGVLAASEIVSNAHLCSLLGVEMKGHKTFVPGRAVEMESNGRGFHATS